MTRTELIAALEKLTEPSREIGDEVLFACGWTVDAEHFGDDGHRLWVPPDHDDDWVLKTERPNPTASVDSALSLVPKGWCWQVAAVARGGHFNININRISWAQLAKPCDDIQGFGPGISVRAQANHSNPAIALCIASLKARGDCDG